MSFLILTRDFFLQAREQHLRSALKLPDWD